MEGQSVSPDQAIKLLEEGNSRYVANISEHPNQGQDRRDVTAKGQHPYATFLSCADSRVPVEILCDAGIGDLFVVRNAGNVVGRNELGSIEYSVEHLGVSAFIVMAHSKCGAVKAVYEQGLLEGNLREISERIFPAVEEARKSHPEMTGDSLVDEAAKINVWNSIEDAFKSSESIRDKVRNDTIKVVGAFYNIETGRIHWLGTHPKQAQLVG